MSQNSSSQHPYLLPGIVKDHKGDTYWFSGECFTRSDHMPDSTKDSFITGSQMYMESRPFTQEKILVESH